jgi:hypothetical protein
MIVRRVLMPISWIHGQRPAGVAPGVPLADEPGHCRTARDERDGRPCRLEDECRTMAPRSTRRWLR